MKIRIANRSEIQSGILIRRPYLLISIYDSKNELVWLAGQYLDLAENLAALVNRLVDLEAILRHGYCHPGFKGRTSIKKVLPVMVPIMSYDGMEVGDGDTASALYARMARDEFNPSQIAHLRAELLSYCKLDTSAMVRLHDRLNGFVSS